MSDIGLRETSNAFNVVEASITDLRRALETGSVTAVDLAATYLQRISRYDCHDPSLNAIPLLNL